MQLIIIYLLRQKKNRIRFHKLNDKWKLSKELSQEEKEIKQLQRELALYKNRKSEPKLLFSDHTELLKITLPEIKDIDKEIKKEVQRLKYKNPYVEKKKKSDSYVFPELLTNRFSLDLENASAELYNEDLKEFLEQKEENLWFTMKNEIISSYLVKLNFIIINAGTAETGKMNIFFYFPENVKLYSEKSKIKKVLRKLSKPEFRVVYSPLIKIPDISMGGYKPNYEWCWDLEKEIEKNEFSIEVSGLNHSMLRSLEVYDSIYIDIRQCGNFSIDWTVIDSSLPKAIQGKLNVVVEDSEI